MGDRCNLCNTGEFELVKSQLRDDKVKYKVFRCTMCGHIQLLPRPTEQEDKEFYNKNLQDRRRQKEIDYEKLWANNLFDTARHVRLLRELCDDNTDMRILDIGAGYGFFVRALYEAGYGDVTGIEVSEERRAFAREHTPVPIIDYDVNNLCPDIGTFDIITLFHVLEHMPEPVVFLKKIKILLRPGTFFICEVPNVRELLLEQCPAYNDFYWIRAHLNYFSRDTLANCFRRAGYVNVEMRFEQRYGLINLCNWFTVGKPQIERPVFEISDAYKPVEVFYRDYLASQGRSDALIAIARG